MWQLILEGETVTPIVTKKTQFGLLRCKVRIKDPRRRYYNKIEVGRPMYPYSFQCYLGTLEFRYNCNSEKDAWRKLRELIKIRAIGRFVVEGLGQIRWIGGQVIKYRPEPPTREYPKLRIRKGLPHNLPKDVQDMLRYALLHDFVHTSKHMSKIYIEPDLEGLEELRKHHDKTNDKLIQAFQRYDRLAALITRNIRSPRTNRYNWYSKGTIKFEKLAQDIKEVANNIWKLYDYIYKSKELEHLTESLQYGHTSLRNHLLLIANLIVQDFLRNRL